jgi:hypothetical protein
LTKNIFNVLLIPYDLQEYAMGKKTTTKSAYELYGHVELGQGKKKYFQLMKKHSRRPVQILAWADELLDSEQFKWTTEKEKVRFVAPTAEELGLIDGASYGEICFSGLVRGLHICPPEVALWQPILWGMNNFLPTDWFTLAMQPITTSTGNQRVLSVGNDNGWPHIAAVSIYEARTRNSRFVFLEPRIKI